jgi:hypothetical protein
VENELSPRSLETNSMPVADGKINLQAITAYIAGDFARIPIMIGSTSNDLGGPDGYMAVGAREWAGLLAAHSIPVYYYRFSYVADSVRSTDSKGVPHADDIPYFFDTVDAKYGSQSSDRDRKMAGIVSEYLVNFVKTGDPNDSHLPEWPSYSKPGKSMMSFNMDASASAGPDPRAKPVHSVSPMLPANFAQTVEAARVVKHESSLTRSATDGQGEGFVVTRQTGAQLKHLARCKSTYDNEYSKCESISKNQVSSWADLLGTCEVDAWSNLMMCENTSYASTVIP